MKKLIQFLNLPHHISKHIAGENQTETHKKIAGAVIMVFGVSLVKVSYLVDYFTFHMIGDIVGFALHGIGLIPYIHTLENDKNNHPQNEEQQHSDGK